MRKRTKHKINTKRRLLIIVLAVLVAVGSALPAVNDLNFSLFGDDGHVYAASASDLTGDQRADVLKIAKSCEGMTLAQVKKHLKKYGKPLYKKSYAYDWCGWWLSCVAKEAGVKTTVFPHDTFANGFYTWGKKKGLYKSKKSYTPKPGDIALFGSANHTYHVELVYSVSKKGTVKTIGGNTGGKSWPYSVVSKPQVKSGIYGFVKIKYPAAKATHTFSYGLNGGSGSFPAQKVKDGSAVKIPSAKPSKAGYDFQGFYVKRTADATWYVAGSGWVSEKKLGTRSRKLYQPGSSYTIDASWTKGSAKSNYTFYAQWKLRPEFTLKFNPNTGSGSMPQKTIKLTGGTIAFDTVNQFRKPGYMMNGWNVQRIALDGSVYWIVPSSNGWAWKKNADVSERKLYKYTDRFTFGTNGISAGDTIVVWATWKAIPTPQKTVEDGTYHIVSALNPEFGLDIYGGASEKGTNVQLYKNTHDMTQTFDVTYIGNGYYTLVSSDSGMSLDVNDSLPSNKANVQIWTPHGGDNQTWIIHDMGNGFYSIISKCNGLWLDVSGGKAANYTNISMYQENSSLAQSWDFVPVEEETSATEGDEDDYDVDIDIEEDDEIIDDAESGDAEEDDEIIDDPENGDIEEDDEITDDDEDDCVDEGFDADVEEDDNIWASDDETDNEEYPDEALTIDESDISAPVYVWSDWSDFTAEPVSASDTCEVQTVKQYRFRDKQTTTSGEPALNGWTKYDSKISVSTSDYKFGTPVATTTSYANNRKTVTSAVDKGYYYYAYAVASPSDPSGDWCYYADKTRAKVISHMKANFSNSATWAEKRLRYFWYISPNDLGATSGKLKKTVPYCADSTVSVGTFSQKATHYYDIPMFRYNQCYKVKTETTTYYFYKWGAWSAWSETAYSASDTRQVETRTLYRYRELVED